MKNRLTLLTSLIGALLVISAPRSGQAQSTLAPRPNQRSATIVMSNLSRPKMILGVMGAIHTPGVYQFQTDAITVKQLLSQAGETTEAFAGSVRVLRGSYVNMKLFLPSQENFTLKPSDLVIVESKARSAQKVIDFSKIRQASSEVAPPENIQIGLVNLLDYPMLVTLKPGDATLKTVFVDLLKQSPELVRSTQLIEPVARPQNEPIGPDYPLVSGAVLVFDARYVNRSVLPEFPQPFEVKLASQELSQPPALDTLSSAPQITAVSEHADQSPHMTDAVYTTTTTPPEHPDLTPQHITLPPLAPSLAPPQNSMPGDQPAPSPMLSPPMINHSASATQTAPRPYVRNRDDQPPVSPQTQELMAQMAQARANISQIQYEPMPHAAPPRMASNAPIDLTAQIEQNRQVVDPSSWHQPIPDPVSTPNAMFLQATPAQPDNRVAQFEPYDDVRADFPRKQFLENLPEADQKAATGQPFIDDRLEGDRLDSVDATMTQLVPLPTDDPFDIHQTAYANQQFRWMSIGVISLAAICVLTATLWMQFGSHLLQRASHSQHQPASHTAHAQPDVAAPILNSTLKTVHQLQLQTAYDQLQALIEDQLPLSEEVVSLPSGQTLYGEPTISKLFRYDQAHQHTHGHVELQGPHFKINPQKARTRPTAEQASAENASPISAPHFKSARHKTESPAIVPQAELPVMPQQPVSESLADITASTATKTFRVDGPEALPVQPQTGKPHHFEVSAHELLERTRAYIQREKQS